MEAVSNYQQHWNYQGYEVHRKYMIRLYIWALNSESDKLASSKLK